MKYVEKLEPVAGDRYFEKLKLFDNFHPYENDSGKQWTSNTKNFLGPVVQS